LIQVHICSRNTQNPQNPVKTKVKIDFKFPILKQMNLSRMDLLKDLYQNLAPS